MGNENNSYPIFFEFFHLGKTFGLEGSIAYGENFVNNKDFGIDVDGDSESQAHIHARRVMFDGLFYKFPKTGKVDNAFVISIDLFSRKS